MGLSMLIRPQELGAEEMYKLLTGIVVPRPIAWITACPPPAPSISRVQRLHLRLAEAAHDCGEHRPQGCVYKDTGRNILRDEDYGCTSPTIPCSTPSMAWSAVGISAGCERGGGAGP